jgi:hypothetical protein
MRAIIEAGYTREDKLLVINRFRIHQKVLYLSNVLDARGDKLDGKYLYLRQPQDRWSSIIFPTEKPPPRHLRLWREALHSLTPRGRNPCRLGEYLCNSHKIIDWTYDSEAEKNYHRKGKPCQYLEPIFEGQ